jgi:hypothetical protein
MADTQALTRIINTMLQLVNPYDGQAAYRLMELFQPNLPWERSLWGFGFELSNLELLEACDALRLGHLSEASLRNLLSTIKAQIGPDPALENRQKQTLQDRLKEPPRSGGEAYHSIRQLTESIASTYVLQWAHVVSNGTNKPYQPERFAKSVAAFILDKGFSSAFVFNEWFKPYLTNETVTIALPNFLEELHRLVAANPSRNFEVLVAFQRTPSVRPPGWLTPAQVITWLTEQHHSISGVRPSGGMLLEVEARDPYAAAEAARTILRRYSARAELGAKDPINLLNELWVKDFPTVHPLNHAPRGVRVEALSREQQIFSKESETPIGRRVDAAIELLAHMEDKSPAAAIAGGWGAIEGLLADPSNRSSAAEYLAPLVACSLPRAELTALSYKIQKEHPELISELPGCTVNRERALMVARAIANGNPIPLRRDADQAAIRRIQRILSNPTPELKAIRELIASAFQRLYRQRNLILHGGFTSSIALAGSLRTASKLAGAGMDRIVHGLYVNNVEPLELVARANLGIDLIDPNHPERCVDLLGA